jgi:microcystin-dependent protein
LCDGRTYTAPDGTQVTTPDLRNRFIVGAGSEYSVGATGGEKYHTLTVSELPSHYHTVDPPTTNTTTDGAHSHSYSHVWTKPQYNGGLEDGANTTMYDEDWATSTNGYHYHKVDIPEFNSGSTGGGQAHENRPPYYALAFIMKL